MTGQHLKLVTDTSDDGSHRFSTAMKAHCLVIVKNKSLAATAHDKFGCGMSIPAANRGNINY